MERKTSKTGNNTRTRKKTVKTNENGKYYSLARVLQADAEYNVIFGERSNGKTYAALLYGLQQYVTTGKQFAYVRRWQEDIRGKRAATLFANHVANGVISQLTNGMYDNVFNMSGRWYLAKTDEKTKKLLPCNEPFCFAFCLSEVEHDKSSSYPNVTTVIFDEFLTRRYYLPDEFILFMNVLSTIIRNRDNVKIFMLGNTVNKFCPYFEEMGLYKITSQKQGTIDLYEFGENGVKIAVEYCAETESVKPSNKYFAFNNSRLQMITSGKWELAIYPHLPVKYKPKDVLFVFYILFGDAILQANIIQCADSVFLYIHQKTTPIKNEEEQLIYSLQPTNKPNYKRKLISNATDVEKRITQFFAMDKVFYQSNEIGEIVRNYIMTAQKNTILT